MRVYDGKLGVIFFFLVFCARIFLLPLSIIPLKFASNYHSEQWTTNFQTTHYPARKRFLVLCALCIRCVFFLYFFVLISCNSLRLLQNNMDYGSCLCQHFACWRARTPQPHTDDHANEAAKRKSQFNIWTIFATGKTLPFYTVYRSNNMVLK